MEILVKYLNVKIKVVFIQIELEIIGEWLVIVVMIIQGEIVEELVEEKEEESSFSHVPYKYSEL